MGDTRRSEAAADFSRFETNKKDSSIDSDRQSIRTLRTINQANAEVQQSESGSCVRQPEVVSASDGSANVTTTSELVSSVPTFTEAVAQPPTSSTGWLSWLSKSTEQSEPTTDSAETHQNTPETTESIPPQDPPVQPLPETPTPTKQTSSWFGFWSSSSANPTAQKCVEQGLDGDTKVEESVTKENEDVVVRDAPAPAAPAPATAQPSAGSTWASGPRIQLLEKQAKKNFPLNKAS